VLSAQVVTLVCSLRNNLEQSRWMLLKTRSGTQNAECAWHRELICVRWSIFDRLRKATQELIHWTNAISLLLVSLVHWPDLKV
jgi:hypothetical protein